MIRARLGTSGVKRILKKTDQRSNRTDIGRGQLLLNSFASNCRISLVAEGFSTSSSKVLGEFLLLL